MFLETSETSFWASPALQQSFYKQVFLDTENTMMFEGIHHNSCGA
jgi:hypothetical protein